MRFTWEPRDVLPGVRVGKHGRTEQWIIGYDPSAARDERKWALISLEDGMLSCRGQTRVELAERLNSSGDYPLELFEFVKRGDRLAKAEAAKRGDA